MVEVTKEITKEQFDKAKEEGAMSLITNPNLLMGYGVYGAFVFERDGKHFLRYERGDSCD